MYSVAIKYVNMNRKMKPTTAPKSLISVSLR